MLLNQICDVAVTVHFEPLIAVGIIISIVIVLYIIQAVILAMKSKMISNAVMFGKYDEVIKEGEKLLKVYIKYNKRLSTRFIVGRIEYLNFALAVSYFAKSNDAYFLEHINSLIQYENIKQFWLSLFYFQKGDLKIGHNHYVRIERCENMKTNIAFLDGVLLHKQGDCQQAKAKMEGIYTELRHPILKQIADDILS